MSSLNKNYSILIVEPNKNSGLPYSFFKQKQFNLATTASIQKALKDLAQFTPNLVLLSTSFSTDQLIIFLEALKNASSKQIIPLILVVDLTKPLSILPGTSWGKKLGIIHSLSSKKEISATLDRILYS